MLHLHRTINYVAGGVVAVLIVVILVMAFQSPLVVVVDAGAKRYVRSERKADEITEKDVENFVRDFLGQMFTWPKLVPETILQQVAPLATSGLLDRIKGALVQRSEKDFKGKTLSQDVANVRVSVTEKNVIASFDKVLRIDGVPLVIPTELAFSIVRGSSNRWNPMGLYVNGLVEHEGAKN
ncbi:MAG: hypothetical protein AB7K68_15410 [Bacteriovoracia bacterium]